MDEVRRDDDGAGGAGHGSRAADRRVGQLLVGMAAVQLVVPFVAAGVAGGDGSFSTSTIGLFAIGVGVVVVGHVMYLAADMAEESELTI